MSAADKAMGGEPLGRSVSATLSSRTGRWLVYAFVFFWTIPTFGLLVSSFRPEREVKTTGWWSAFMEPEVHALELRDACSRRRRAATTSPTSSSTPLKITIPATVLSVGIAAAGRVRVLVDEVQGPRLAVRRRCRPADGAAADGAHPAVAAVHRRRAHRLGHDLPGPRPQQQRRRRSGSPTAASACRSASSSSRTSSRRCPARSSRPPGSTAPGTHRVHEARRCRCRSRRSRRCRIFQFMWIWNDLLVGKVFGGTDNMPVIGEAGRGDRHAWSVVAPAHSGRHDLDGAAARSVLRVAAVLRARPSGRRRQGMTRPHTGAQTDRTDRRARRLTHTRGAGLAARRCRLLAHGRDRTRLGIPAMRVSDGPAGARGTQFDGGPASVNVPCGTSLAATWDPALVEEVGHLLGRETRAKGASVLLAPTVNLHRTPIGGRNFECMSEDPYLTARIGGRLRPWAASRGRRGMHQALRRQRHRVRAQQRSTRGSTSERCASSTWCRSRRRSKTPGSWR